MKNKIPLNLSIFVFIIKKIKVYVPDYLKVLEAIKECVNY
jgi:hypothetical protein